MFYMKKTQNCEMVENKSFNIIVIGLPGCGKGTQSEKLAKKYNLKHLSSGDILREERKKNTPEGKKINDLIFEGKLLPDELVNSVFLKNIPERNYILDGYPRKLSQVEFIKDVNIVIYLHLNENEAIERILERKDGRKDDNKETVRIRLEAFRKETEPVINFYKEKGIFYEVDGNGTPEDVFERIVRIVEKNN